MGSRAITWECSWGWFYGYNCGTNLQKLGHIESFPCYFGRVRVHTHTFTIMSSSVALRSGFWWLSPQLLMVQSPFFWPKLLGFTAVRRPTGVFQTTHNAMVVETAEQIATLKSSMAMLPLWDRGAIHPMIQARPKPPMTCETTIKNNKALVPPTTTDEPKAPQNAAMACTAGFTQVNHNTRNVLGTSRSGICRSVFGPQRCNGSCGISCATASPIADRSIRWVGMMFAHGNDTYSEWSEWCFPVSCVPFSDNRLPCSKQYKSMTPSQSLLQSPSSSAAVRHSPEVVVKSEFLLFKP